MLDRYGAVPGLSWEGIQNEVLRGFPHRDVDLRS